VRGSGYGIAGWASVLSLERLCVSDLCQIGLTIVGDSRRIRQLAKAATQHRRSVPASHICGG